MAGEKSTITLDLHFMENKVEFAAKTSRLVRAATVRIQSLAVANLMSGIYTVPEDPKRRRTGALANSVYSDFAGSNDLEEKQSAALSLNPKAGAPEIEWEPKGPVEGKAGVGVEYGLYMEAYMPFLEPAAAAVQEEIADLFESA